MIRNLLRKIAKKHLDLVDKENGYGPECRAVITAANKDLAESNHRVLLTNNALNCEVTALREYLDKVKRKYPTVWMSGDVAQGVMQLPRLGVACEFFREENKLCIFVPWDKAAGAKDVDLVPEWLEIDESLPITSIMDKMGDKNNGILFKIPIKSWLDTYETVQNDNHPSYGLDGRALEKTKTFRCKAGINGMFRRELTANDKLYIHLYFNEFDMPNPERVKDTPHYFFPLGGNMELDPAARIPDDIQFETFGEEPNRIYYWRLPMVHVDRPRLKGAEQRMEAITAAGKESLRLARGE